MSTRNDLLPVVKDYLRARADAFDAGHDIDPPTTWRLSRPFVSAKYPTRDSLPQKAQDLLTHVLDRGAWTGPRDRYGQMLVRHGYAKKIAVGGESRIVGL